VEDSLLALAVPGFDLIVGGHSHSELKQPVKVGGTWIVQAGDQGRFLGVDTLSFRAGKGITSLRGGLRPVVEGAAPPAEDVAALVAEQERRVQEELGGQVAVLEGDWTRDSRGESNIGNWLCAALRAETGAQAAFWNSGGIRKDLAAGPVTERDLWEISPFGNQVLVVPLSGARLRQVFADELRRGGLHMQFDGLRVGAAEDGGVGAILLAGKPVLEGGRYRVAMTDYVWSQLRQPEDSLLKVEATGRVDRDVLIDRARAEKTIKPVLDGRWGPGRPRGKG
jgi:2',3'-cyclic-nucleotide 2'-phosphodiesterase (5'-nucleotidase family)